MASQEITHLTAGAWKGERVRVLKTEQIGPRVWCRVERADCPGLITMVQRDHVAAWGLLQQTRALRDRIARKPGLAQRAAIAAKDVQRLEGIFA